MHTQYIGSDDQLTHAERPEDISREVFQGRKLLFGENMYYILYQPTD